MADLYLGGTLRGGKRTARLAYDAAHLTTHGVIVGMTGSGKTGLGIIFLEEALRRGVPSLIIDPKGDMTNLLLTFPRLRPEDFAPWIDPGAADGKGGGPAAAADTAAMWRRGLADWELDGKNIEALRSAAGFTIYTPGSRAGIPLDVVGSLARPTLDWEKESEVIGDEIESFVTGLLGLAGIESDPITSKEHILISNLISDAWQRDVDLDLPGLLARIQAPPIRKLGVFDLDTFYPEKERLALAMRLNGLLASPSFSTWMEGPSLDVARMLHADGKPQAAIVYLAHLSDSERQFAVTLLLSKVVTWMRSQPGTGGLRALIYMDEVFGYVPPVAEPPAKKPILTILKQARAFGVGMLLSTQNPVDLDYKAMSNAGTWCIGRLQTERDKKRILEGLTSATGGTDIAQIDELISALEKRQFILHSTRRKHPDLFTTRWAMSFLRGPLTKDQVGILQGDDPRRDAGTASPTSPIPQPTPAGTSTPPGAAKGTRVAYLDPGAAWSDLVGADFGGDSWTAALAVGVALIFDESRADIAHEEQWEAVIMPLGAAPDPRGAVEVDHDLRDFRDTPDRARTFVLPDAAITTRTYFREAAAAIRDHLYVNHTLEVFRNRPLKVYSRPGETRDDFTARCSRLARERADEKVQANRASLERRLQSLRRRAGQARRRAEEQRAAVSATVEDEVLEGIGDLLGGLLGGRRRTVRGAAKRRSRTRAAERRADQAHAKWSADVEELHAEEAEVAAEVAAIYDDWAAKGEAVENAEIRLEKNDIRVQNITLLWVPT